MMSECGKQRLRVSHIKRNIGKSQNKSKMLRIKLDLTTVLAIKARANISREKGTFVSNFILHINTHN